MSSPLARDDPKLQEAVARLRRLCWVWALMCAGVGGLSLAVGGAEHAGVALGWIALATMLVTLIQPLLLASVAVSLGFSLVLLVPGVETTLGPDPLAGLLGGGVPGMLGMGMVRIVLMVTAWSQLLFYRLLYGTARVTGLDPHWPAIPELIPNLSDRAAWAARLIGFAALVLSLACIPLRAGPNLPYLLGLAYSLSVLSTGLGLGAAFSPTNRRGTALAGVILGMVALFVALLIGRAFLV